MNPVIGLKRDLQETETERKNESINLYNAVCKLIDVDDVYHVLTLTIILRNFFNEKSENSEYPHDIHFNDGVVVILDEVSDVLENIKNTINGLHPGFRNPIENESLGEAR